MDTVLNSGWVPKRVSVSSVSITVLHHCCTKELAESGGGGGEVGEGGRVRDTCI
jgi:hypothetical protein